MRLLTSRTGSRAWGRRLLAGVLGPVRPPDSISASSILQGETRRAEGVELRATTQRREGRCAATTDSGLSEVLVDSTNSRVGSVRLEGGWMMDDCRESPRSRSRLGRVGRVHLDVWMRLGAVLGFAIPSALVLNPASVRTTKPEVVQP